MAEHTPVDSFGGFEHVSERHLGIRVPEWLKDGIAECAQLERRRPSDWLRLIIEDAVEARLSKVDGGLEARKSSVRERRREEAKPTPTPTPTPPTDVGWVDADLPGSL